MPTARLSPEEAPVSARSAEEITLHAADGVALVADLHRPPGEVRAAAVLAPAMGVRRGFYAPFATFLAEAGIAVLCLDYRGVGREARRHVGATLAQWGEQDLEAALAESRRRHPAAPQVWIGHSIGGQLFGLLRRPAVERALLVASQNGFWGHWPGPRKLALAALWHAGIPLVVRVAGRLPMKAFRQGEDVAAGVALQWAAWGRSPEYILGYEGLGPESAFHAFTGPLRMVAIEDDHYAPPRTVRALARGFRTPHKEIVEISAREAGVAKLGHFGPFRPAMRDVLWPRWRDFLLGR